MKTRRSCSTFNFSLRREAKLRGGGSNPVELRALSAALELDPSGQPTRAKRARAPQAIPRLPLQWSSRPLAYRASCPLNSSARRSHPRMPIDSKVRAPTGGGR
jgi:hypothetical protein